MVKSRFGWPRTRPDKVRALSNAISSTSSSGTRAFGSTFGGGAALAAASVAFAFAGRLLAFGSSFGAAVTWWPRLLACAFGACSAPWPRLRRGLCDRGARCAGFAGSGCRTRRARVNASGRPAPASAVASVRVGALGGPPMMSFPSSIAVGSPRITSPKTVRTSVPSPLIRSARIVRSRSTTSTASAPLRFEANSFTPATSFVPSSTCPR